MIPTALLAVRTKLLTSAALNHATTGVNSQWYFKMAHRGFTYPYGLIDLNAGGQADESGVQQADLRFLLKIVGSVNSSFTEIAFAQLAETLRQLLHEATLTGDSSWHIWRCQHLTPIFYSELDGEISYVHAGGIYRIRMSG